MSTAILSAYYFHRNHYFAMICEIIWALKCLIKVILIEMGFEIPARAIFDEKINLETLAKLLKQ